MSICPTSKITSLPSFISLATFVESLISEGLIIFILEDDVGLIGTTFEKVFFGADCCELLLTRAFSSSSVSSSSANPGNVVSSSSSGSSFVVLFCSKSLNPGNILSFSSSATVLLNFSSENPGKTLSSSTTSFFLGRPLLRFGTCSTCGCSVTIFFGLPLPLFTGCTGVSTLSSSILFIISSFVLLLSSGISSSVL